MRDLDRLNRDLCVNSYQLSRVGKVGIMNRKPSLDRAIVLVFPVGILTDIFQLLGASF